MCGMIQAARSTKLQGRQVAVALMLSSCNRVILMAAGGGAHLLIK